MNTEGRYRVTVVMLKITRDALRSMAMSDGETMAEIIRHLIRQEAKRRDLWGKGLVVPDYEEDEEEDYEDIP